MDGTKKGCYYCKYNYNIKKGKSCPNLYKIGYDPCDKFAWAASFKSFNHKKKKK